MDRKVIEVECQCGQAIARYEKVKKGRLIKMYLDMIRKDYGGIFRSAGGGGRESGNLQLGEAVICPNCKRRLATIRMIHGRPAAKMNQGAIKQVRT